MHFPIDSWQNEVLEELQLRGAHITNFPSVRPYSMEDVNSFENTLLYGKLLLPAFSVEMQYDTVNVLRLKPAIGYKWSLFSVFVQPVVKFGEDSLPPKEVFMDLFSADYERAYIKLDHKYFNLFIGRERFAIGPSPRYNLLLSGHAAPMDWFSYSLRSNTFRFSFYISRLDDLHAKPLEYSGDTITQYITANRYLSIKRFDYSPAEWLNFGLSEGAVFGGEDYTLEIYHFNPIVFLQAYQYNWGKDVNFFLNFDSRIFLHNFSFYGSLLIDDFQLESDPNNEPHHLGINVGIECADPFRLNKIFWMIEYTAVTQYTYSHFIPYQRYHYRDTPIGSLFGADYDEFFTKLTYHLKPFLDLYSQISYARKGETYIESIWPIHENPRVQGDFFPNGNFLSGIVQNSITVGIGFRFFHHSWFLADLLIGYLHATDFDHNVGNTKRSIVAKLRLDLMNL